MKTGFLSCAIVVLLEVSTMAAGAEAAGGPQKAKGFTDAELTKIRDGFEARRDGAFQKLAGKPFKPAAIAEPLNPGRPPYVRGYTYSVTDFAMLAMWHNQQLPEANQALQDLCKMFIDKPDVRDDYDNFYWCMDVVLRLEEFFGPKGSRAAGRLTEQTRDQVHEMLWLWGKKHYGIELAEIEKSGTWALTSSENHHLQGFTTAWHLAKLLKDDPRYRDRAYDDGKNAAEHYAAWGAYAKEYFRQRAKKGFLMECGNSNYGLVGMKGVYNMYDFADDPVLKKRAGLMLDLWWAPWAQEQIDGVRGGGRSRIYQGGGSLGGEDNLSLLAWYYMALGRERAPRANDYTILTSSYRPPLAVYDIALDVAGRGVYEARQWPLSRADLNEDRHAVPYHVMTDVSGLLRYSYCTPEFILGTTMCEARENFDWLAISAQNRWQGVIFAGDGLARIVPQVRGLNRNRCYNGHWSVQSKGTLITQKLKTATNAGEMRVWFSTPGLTDRLEKDGWVFVQAPRAYAAVRIVDGEYDWKADEDKRMSFGQWLTCRKEYSPVILEVVRKSEAESYSDFQKRILAAPLTFKDNVLQYKSPYGEEFTFHADYSKVPTINGTPVDYSLRKAFESSFVQADWDSGVVTVQKGSRKAVLDFNAQ